MNSSLSDKITHRTACVAIIGMGYVGLPLALAFAKAGFTAVGIEISAEKVAALNAGHSYIEDVADAELAPHLAAGRLRATGDYAVLRECDAVFICVPTPYTIQRTPDLSYIISATESIAPYLRAGQLVVLQSTTYPGTTTEVCQPILEKVSGLHAAQDEFYLAFSPERIDPGNQKWSAYNTPKVVGGLTPEATTVAAALLRQMGAPVHEVSSPSAAELTKLLENTFRAVNIGLVNEVAMMCARLGIDTWEVIEAAASKPFGFLPFYPGPGLGGHCIPIDPLYLSWKLKVLKYNARFIQLADEINSSMPEFVVGKIADALNQRRKSVHGSRVLVCGVAYKRNISDLRESPALDIIELLHRRGAQVHVHDTHVPAVVHDGVAVDNVSLDRVEDYDCVAIVTDHGDVDYASLVDRAQLVVDARNATRDVRLARSDKVVSI
jgi:UDP-N-acetyl-D-glucosamine dehydrogenase